MKLTKNLNLPVYDDPINDMFDLTLWNEANEAIDKSHEEVMESKKLVEDIFEEIPKVNASAEVIDARGSFSTLGEKTRDMDRTIISKSGWTLNMNEFPRLAGETCDSFRFQRAIDMLQRLNTAPINRNARGGRLDIPVGDYYFFNSVYIGKSKDTANQIPFPIHIRGEVNAFEGHLGLGVNLFVKSNNPVFMVNINASGVPSLTNNGYGHLTMENLNFTTPDEDKVIANKSTGIRLHMTRLILKNITCQSMYSLIDQDQYLNGVQTYSDFWILENIRFRNLRGVGIRTWYCDNLTIKGIFCEYPERASRIVDITNSEGFNINGLCCAMTERYDNNFVINDSAMVYVTSSIGSITNMYVENVKQFGAAIGLVASNVVVNSYSERFEGNSGIVMWNSQLQINGSSFKAKRNNGFADIEVKGNIDSQSRILINNTVFSDMSRPGGVISDVKRNIVYKFANNSVEHYSDDMKSVRLKWDNTTESLKVMNYNNTKELDIGNTPGNATFEADGMVFHSTSIFRYKKITGITTIKNASLALDYAIKVLGDGFGGYLKIGAYKSVEGVPISWTVGEDRKKIDCIINFE